VIRLLISDDSAFMRIAIRKMAESDPEIEIVGEARTGQMCVEMAEALRPDVITMDVEMPVMNGLEATRQIMGRCPCPIIMLSSLTERNSVTTIKALELGAVDFIAKQSSFVQLDIVKIGGELVEKIRFWAKKRSRFARTPPATPSGAVQVPVPAAPTAARPPAMLNLRRPPPPGVPGVIVLGISTGGPATLPQMLKAMGGPLRCPLIVAQHMPPMFTSGFAAHLRTETGLDVVESSDGMEAIPGRVVIIKGGTDAVIREPFPGRLLLQERTNEAAPIHPNADVLFRSAVSLSCNVAAVIMTGMGSDGCQGAQELVARKGSAVYVQDPATCIVDGMPGSAIQAGLATAVLSPQDLGMRLARLAGRGIMSAVPTP